MSLLRIFCSLAPVPAPCQWVLFDDHAGAHPGEGTLAELPKGATQVELVLAASQVLITRARLPTTSKRQSAALLAYAAEERLASDPDANQVSRLGQIDGDEALAVVNRQRLQSWRDALGAVGIHVDAVYCETLMLPVQSGEWSLAWNGLEGYVRTGEFAGSATDCGDAQTPPMALQLLLEDARAHGAVPTLIALHVATPAAQPDLAAWQHSLGVDIRLAPQQNWRLALATAGVRIDHERQPWRPSAATLTRWRHVGWILLAALILHSTALLADRIRLTNEQQQLRQQMETRFRSMFPKAVAVADPALQTRRQLAQARHTANQPDAGDFPVMLGKVVAALTSVPTAQLHALSYEDGRMTLEFTAPGDALTRQIQACLTQAGFAVDVPRTTPRSVRGALTLTLRSP
jgi:Type II secretory pathway, component PulL